MVTLNLNPRNHRSLIEQIVTAVQGALDGHTLSAGDRMPSIRTFANEHRISRHTVVEAYDRLVALGCLDSRPGSGFYVAQRQYGEASAGDTNRRYDGALLIRQVLEDSSDMVKVGGPWLPDTWLDQEAIQSIVRALGREPGGHLLHYGHPSGYLPLRQQLQLKLSELGIAAPSDQIVLTNGASHALELSIRYLVRPGDAILVDDPGYYNLYANLRQYGARLLGVPRNPDGPDIVALRTLAAEHRPKAYFTQTAMQNPTGTDMSPPVMYRVLQIAEEFDFTIVEDDTYCDMQAAPAPRLATLDQLNHVIYVRSFSKTLSGSIRVGFTVASKPIVEKLLDIKVVSCITTSQFNEKLVYRMLIEGHYRKHLDRLRARTAQARADTLKLFQSAGLQVFAEPANSNLMWARFPHVEDSALLVSRARADDIMLAPGMVFRPNLEPSPWMRFNVAQCGDARLAHFLAKIAAEAPTAQDTRRATPSTVASLRRVG